MLGLTENKSGTLEMDSRGQSLPPTVHPGQQLSVI